MQRAMILKNLLNKNSNAKGLLGETLAIQGLRRYTSVKKTSRIGHSGDCKIHNTNIEIKTALPSKKNDYRVCLRKKDEYGYTDFRNSAYVLIQLVSSAGNIVLYLIPTIAIIDLKNLCLGLNSKKYASFKVSSYSEIVKIVKGTK